jgi:hypothetical protein
MAVCAVTIEPFEVSLRRGGCGGAMGFQSAGDGSWSCGATSEVVCSRTSMLLGLTSEWSVWHAGGWLGFEAGEEDVLRRGAREHA